MSNLEIYQSPDAARALLGLALDGQSIVQIAEITGLTKELIIAILDRAAKEALELRRITADVEAVNRVDDYLELLDGKIRANTRQSPYLMRQALALMEFKHRILSKPAFIVPTESSEQRVKYDIDSGIWEDA
jgi:hypothetical protein